MSLSEHKKANLISTWVAYFLPQPHLKQVTTLSEP